MGPGLRRLLALAGALGLMADGPPDEAARVIAVTSARTAAVKSYTFALHVDFALRSFPYIGFHLDGTGRWERPNLYSIRFHSVPVFGKGFEHIKLNPLDPASWHEDYDILQVSENGLRHAFEMREKAGTAHVKGVHAELDADGLRQITWSYQNGGTIRVEVDPITINGVPVPGEERADIKVPGYHVVAHARFDDYKLVTEDGAQ